MLAVDTLFNGSFEDDINRGFNDDMRIVLIKPDGTEVQLAFESVDGSAFSLVGGIDFPGGDSTVGHTAWKPVSQPIAVAPGQGAPDSFTHELDDAYARE